MKSNSCCVVVTMLALVGSLAPKAGADPCGMVPPIYIEQPQLSLARVGLQKTYVFYKDGLETLVIRPGTAYGGKNNLSPGFWVYAYPNWYIWRR